MAKIVDRRGESSQNTGFVMGVNAYTTPVEFLPRKGKIRTVTWSNAELIHAKRARAPLPIEVRVEETLSPWFVDVIPAIRTRKAEQTRLVKLLKKKIGKYFVKIIYQRLRPRH